MFIETVVVKHVAILMCVCILTIIIISDDKCRWFTILVLRAFPCATIGEGLCELAH